MNKPDGIDAPSVIARLDAAARIVITTHTRADGDAVGSAAALKRVLRQRGRDAAVYLHEPILDRYAFLDRIESMSVWDPAAVAKTLADADLLVVLDTCAASQLGEAAETIKTSTIKKLAVDHHKTRDGIVDEALFNEGAGACALIISQLFETAGWMIDAGTATALYAGLATDTGWFRFSNADAATYEAAAKLVRQGASPVDLYERLYLSDHEARARLIGAVLSSFELLAEGRLAVIRLTQEMLTRCGATREMTEEIINEPQRLGSVIACVLLVEPVGDGPVRVSLRSKRNVDVAAIASQFGGGGHQRAAGARVRGTIDSVAKQVIPRIVQALDHPPGGAERE